MDFDYSDEQQLLRESVARFVREEYAFAARKQLIASGQAFSAAHWSLFAELGWLAVPLPESCGGLGGSAVDAAIVLEEFGRGLVLEPWIPTLVLGAGAIAALGSGGRLRRPLELACRERRAGVHIGGRYGYG